MRCGLLMKAWGYESHQVPRRCEYLERNIMTEYYVDFSSVTIDEDTYSKLMNDPDFAKQWILENAEIDQIIKADLNEKI